MSLEDVILQATIGMSKKTFLRTANLMRNPEGPAGNLICPVCKKPIRTNDQGDSFCADFSFSFEKNGGCYWHRYSDGLNYWSDPAELFRVKCEEFPELKEMIEQTRTGHTCRHCGTFQKDDELCPKCGTDPHH